MSKIRTRYAPSPTGRMHVGNLRTALYAYLIAKHEGGDFLLRIEDTDQERYVEGAVDIIYRTLKETGLVHDEGPDKDKGNGPYVQSERVKSGLYMGYAKQLIEKGAAYYCFCTKERLESLKEVEYSESGEKTEITKYDKHCLYLSKAEIEANLAAGKPFVIRQNVPREGTTTFHDVIYGDITVNNEELDDQILIKSDGYPTYNFANVIDDHLMGITHVVRGNEYLSSTPKYTLLYNAFGWEEPVYIHCPLITNEEHQKLSKRSGHSSFEDLIEQGFVEEAVVNFVALLGWSPEGNQEIFSLEELVKEFDYHHISKSPAVFDMVKLRWMDGEYIKAMAEDKYLERAVPYVKEVVKKPLDYNKIAMLVKTRIEVFPDIAPLIDFFDELPEYDVAMYTHKKMKTNSENSLQVLKELLPRLKAQEDYSIPAITELVTAYIAEKEIKNGMALWPLRTAVSGKQMTPGGAYEIMEILGKDESLRRIQVGIEKLEKAVAEGQ
jgi:glutamyl-tRNA synthetase